jgi:hypothetical protein
MTSYAAPPISPGSALPPTDDLPPIPVADGPRRGALACGVTALVVTAGAAMFSAVMLARPAPAAVHTIVMPPPAPVYSAEEVAAARAQVCKAWEVTSTAMAQATRSAAAAPAEWDDPLTREAHGYEARIALVESSYLESQLAPATPGELASAIHTYLVATFDQEDATMRKMGSQVNAAIDRGNAAIDRVNVACGYA